MALHKISETTLRRLKATDKTVEGKERLDDGGGQYLLLEVKGGSRAWRFDNTIAGKRKSVSLGTYTDTTFKLAHQQADAAREPQGKSLKVAKPSLLRIADLTMTSRVSYDGIAARRGCRNRHGGNRYGNPHYFHAKGREK